LASSIGTSTTTPLCLAASSMHADQAKRKRVVAAVSRTAAGPSGQTDSTVKLSKLTAAAVDWRMPTVVAVNLESSALERV